jgi:hypothetical protein
MKINRPNNWEHHQRFAGKVPHPGECGTAYVITPQDDPAEAADRVRKLREAVMEVTGMPTAPIRPPMGFVR